MHAIYSVKASFPIFKSLYLAHLLHSWFVLHTGKNEEQYIHGINQIQFICDLFSYFFFVCVSYDFFLCRLYLTLKRIFNFLPTMREDCFLEVASVSMTQIIY